MTIRQTIWRAKKRAGISVSELARLAGVHRGNLSMFLSGKRDTNVETLEKIMAVLELAIVEK